MKKLSKTASKILLCLGVAVFLVLALILIINIAFWAQGKHIVTPDELNEKYDAVIVLGCGVKADGTPTDMLYDRVKTASDLYLAGYSEKVIMSGDSENADYDETGVMKRLAIEFGVPEEAIVTDPYGLSTYDTMKRAADVYGVKKPLIVTQKYHLFRAIYIARDKGMEADGVSADLRSYRKMPIYGAREILARCKDFLTCIIDPEAKYAG